MLGYGQHSDKDFGKGIVLYLWQRFTVMCRDEEFKE